MKHLFNTTECLSMRQIQSYLDGKLNQQDRFQVENHLLDCSICSAATEGYEQMGITEDDHHFLGKFNAESEVKKTDQAIRRTLEPRNNRFVFRKIAAAITLLMIPLSVFLYTNSNQTDPLYDKYFEHYPIIDGTDSRGKDVKTIDDADLKKAIEKYNQKEYKESVPLFESYLNRETEDTQNLFYAGIANLEAGKLQKADDLLTTVRINDDRLFEDSTWYLILTKLKAKQRAEAVVLLEELLNANDSGYYTEKAKTLLAKLK